MDRQRKYNYSISGRYRELVRRAKEHKRELKITKSEYEKLINNACYYCDADISVMTGYALNRIDNSKGYTLDNVKPCCTVCNKIMNNFSLQMLESRVYKIIKRMRKLSKP